MSQLKRKIKDIAKRFDITRENTITLLVFIVIVITVFVGATFFHQQLSSIVFIIFLIELSLIALATWIMAAHAVMKTLFWVGASLSLIIFLSQSYCDLPNIVRTGDDALKTLLSLGLVYIAFNFLWSLYKEIASLSKTLKKLNKGKKPWIILLPFALFTGIFVWQIYQVVQPIVQNLCIYK